MAYPLHRVGLNRCSCQVLFLGFALALKAENLLMVVGLAVLVCCWAASLAGSTLNVDDCGCPILIRVAQAFGKAAG